MFSVVFIDEIISELLDDRPVEFNDCKELCRTLSIKNWQDDFPYLYLNQHILKDIVRKRLNR